MKSIIKMSIQSMIGLLIVAIFWATQASGSECGILQLQTNKSSAVRVQRNTCNEINAISFGTVIYLPAHGRLWLQSKAMMDNRKPYQMICQNRGQKTLELEFSASQSPWLNTQKHLHCSNWTNNKLSCHGQQSNQKGLYCVLSYMKPVAERLAGVERTTSLKMRQLVIVQPEKKISASQKIIQAITPELKLCKTVNQISSPVDLRWLISPTGVAKSIDIRLDGKQLTDQAIRSCVESTLASFPYPLLFKSLDLEVTF